MVGTLNSIVDGPPIENDLELERVFPKPFLPKVEDFPSEETPRHRKSWLEEAFLEELKVPMNPTLMVSPFIRPRDKRMKRPEVLNKAFLVPPMAESGPTIEEEREIWVNRVMNEISDKSRVLAREDYCHGDKDWLVLWDRLGTPRWDIERRAEKLAKSMANLWNSAWFSKVFVQDEDFDWQLMFFTGEYTILESNR